MKGKLSMRKIAALTGMVAACAALAGPLPETAFRKTPPSFSNGTDGPISLSGSGRCPC